MTTLPATSASASPPEAPASTPVGPPPAGPPATSALRRAWGRGAREARRAGARLGTVGAQVLVVPEHLRSRRPATFDRLCSQAASAVQAEHPRYLAWMQELGAAPDTQFHRKIWEWCFILEALQQAGEMAPGNRAVGFGVGHERIPAILASRGVRVVATDVPAEHAAGWADTGQHAAALEELRCDDICPPDRFGEFVTYRPVDMTKLPEDLAGFDLLWSSCAFEHLGRPERGTAFVLDSLGCLRPGGVAVHTTELRVEGKADADFGGTVLYSIGTMERLIARLRLRGHHVRANFHIAWDSDADRFIDEPPYAHRPYHLKLRVSGELTTSSGLIVRKRGG
jgi:Methyltransferase domain